VAHCGVVIVWLRTSSFQNAKATAAAAAGTECSIYMDRITNTVIVPCGHQFCAECVAEATEVCHNSRQW